MAVLGWGGHNVEGACGGRAGVFKSIQGASA